MNKKSNNLSFGRYLQKIRLEKGIRLEDVSKETRIRLDNLLLIEKEDHEHLPAQIFVKGFLRAYAKAIGADDQEALKRYTERYKAYEKAVNSEVVLNRLRASVWSSFGWVMVAAFCLIGFAIFIASTMDQPSNTHLEKSFQKIEPETADIHQNKGTGEANATAIPESIEGSNGKLLLKVTAVKDTWMKVIVDGQSPENFNLSAGDRLEFEAFSGFNLLIGDAAGVHLQLNEKPYEVAGDEGQAVTIQIP